MKIPNIIELIEKGETIESKRNFSSKTIETVVAFANSKGGFIILGIEDSENIITMLWRV